MTKESVEDIILILIRDDDRSTDLVCFWLKRLKKSYFVVTSTDRISLKEENSEIFLCKNDDLADSLSLTKITSIYNFMGQIGASFTIDISKSLEIQIANNILNENTKILKFLLQHNLIRKLIGSLGFNDKSFNKLEQLSIAEEVGFKIPKYQLVSTKTSLEKCLATWKRMIVKNVDDGITLVTSDYNSFSQRTVEVSQKEIEKFPKNFGISFVQELIESAFEIRIIYLCGAFYSIAQIDDFKIHNDVDIRDSINSLRIQPIKLPENIENKIKKMMDKMDLNYGAIDVILGKDDEYYFLEVNPFGQFGFVSYFGNFNIEKAIAEYL